MSEYVLILISKVSTYSVQDNGFTYIALEELIKGTEKLPMIKILSLLHDRLIEKMQQANRLNDDNSRENTEDDSMW